MCACCYLGADCLCGLPFSCDVFDVKMKVASHNSKGFVHKAMMFVFLVVSQDEEQSADAAQTAKCWMEATCL